MHFLQSTTTSFGIKRFILENKLVWKVQLCLQELRVHCSPIKFPLTKFLEETDKKIVRDIISRYKTERDSVLIELSLLNGDCTQETEGIVRCSGMEIESSLDARSRITYPPFFSYLSDLGHKEFHPIGAKAIMECAADLYQGSILGFLSGCQQGRFADDPRQAFQEWQKKPSEPIYEIVYDFANEIVGKPVPPGTLLALLDLALCAPLDFSFNNSSHTYHQVESNPGRRLLEALLCAKRIGFMETSLPYVNSDGVNIKSSIGYNFHETYKPYINKLCKILNWPLPWEVMTDALQEFLMENFSKNLPGLCQILLNGLALRKNMPSFCANPLQDTKPFFDQGITPMVIECHEFLNPSSFDPKSPVIFCR